MGNRNSGPKPKSTALKILRGNPSREKLDPAREPKPPKSEVVAPKWLSKEARTHWDWLAPISLAMGTVSVADAEAFGQLCQLLATQAEVAAWKGTPAFQLLHDGQAACGSIR